MIFLKFDSTTFSKMIINNWDFTKTLEFYYQIVSQTFLNFVSNKNEEHKKYNWAMDSPKANKIAVK